MKILRMVFPSLLALSAGFGTTLEPCFYYERLLDRAVGATRSDFSREAALQLLRHVAEGHPERITPDMAKAVELNPQELEGPCGRSPGVRAKAHRAIGRTGLPEALAYLQSLTPEQFGDVRSRDRHEVWPAAQTALQEARLTQIKTPRDQVAFLENAVSLKYDSFETGTILVWAIQKLCDMGSSPSLPLIEKRLISLYSRNGDAEIAFCRERMQVVQRHPSRASALGSVLDVGTSAAHQRLTRWAISELCAMRSADADRELDRFEAEVRAIHPVGRNPPLVSFVEQISRIRATQSRSVSPPRP